MVIFSDNSTANFTGDNHIFMAYHLSLYRYPSAYNRGLQRRLKYAGFVITL
jgi:hypothetical protein